MTGTAKPRIALDIRSGSVENIESNWQQIHDTKSEGYRWLHFDLNDEAFEPWAFEKLPEVVVRAFLQKETRPRCEIYDQGLAMNLRGINITPKESPEDMVSLRVWVEKKPCCHSRASTLLGG